jgi:uncharacterized protein
MTNLVLDTGGIYALLDSKDPDHGRCVAAISDAADLIVPPLVLVEVDYWCRKGTGGVAAFSAFMADVMAGAYRLESLDDTDILRATELETEYASLELGLVDASVIALCERLGEQTVLTLDRRDFSVVRPRHCVALNLLPE